MLSAVTWPQARPSRKPMNILPNSSMKLFGAGWGGLSQGKLEAAVEAYRVAAEQWAAQRVVVWFSLANALVELGK